MPEWKGAVITRFSHEEDNLCVGSRQKCRSGTTQLSRHRKVKGSEPVQTVKRVRGVCGTGIEYTLHKHAPLARAVRTQLHCRKQSPGGGSTLPGVFSVPVRVSAIPVETGGTGRFSEPPTSSTCTGGFVRRCRDRVPLWTGCRRSGGGIRTRDLFPVDQQPREDHEAASRTMPKVHSRVPSPPSATLSTSWSHPAQGSPPAE